MECLPHQGTDRAGDDLVVVVHHHRRTVHGGGEHPQDRLGPAGEDITGGIGGVLHRIGNGELRHIPGIFGEQGPFLGHPIPGGKEHLHPAHGHKADHDHQGHDGEMFGEDTLKHRRTPHPAFGSLTSNLYPTPQTVLSVHWSETPSSFSRRRLTCTSTVRLSP